MSDRDPIIRVLILGGTTEGSAIAAAVAGDHRFAAVLSMAGATWSPRPGPVSTRIGGFGGASGLAAWLRRHGIHAAVDATHPFARQIGRNAIDACAAASVPLLRVLRPAWTAGAGDRWTEVPTMEDAVRALGAVPKRVLLAVGRKELSPCLRTTRHHFVVRSIDPPPVELLPPGCDLVTARGPFDLPGERALLDRHRIEAILCKNSGGAATVAKLIAARERALPVVMLARPPPPEGAERAPVADWRDAIAWLEARHRAAFAVPRGV